MDRYHGNLPVVLAAYNAGEQAVMVYRGVPPYPETRRYVSRILRRIGRPDLVPHRVSGGHATVIPVATTRIDPGFALLSPPSLAPSPSQPRSAWAEEGALEHQAARRAQCRRHAAGSPAGRDTRKSRRPAAAPPGPVTRTDGSADQPQGQANPCGIALELALCMQRMKEGQMIDRIISKLQEGAARLSSWRRSIAWVPVLQQTLMSFFFDPQPGGWRR
jgi:hypothetical protein